MSNAQYTRLRSYMDAVELAQTRKRKLGNNTVLVTDHAPTSYAVRYHSTDIVTYRKDGSIVLSSGGWRTSTTKERINEYIPFYRLSQ